VLGLGELININFKPTYILCGLNLEVESFVFKRVLSYIVAACTRLYHEKCLCSSCVIEYNVATKILLLTY
jgi:hypothetical protein